MDSIESFRAFTRVVERGSFSRVAEELQVKQSTVSKWMQALESQLGVQLLERTTRAMHVTDAGQRFYQAALDVLHAYDAAVGSVCQDDTGLRGRIRVSVPEVFGRLHVVPHVARFSRRNPALSLELSFADRYVDLVGEGFDLAIRLGQPTDSTLRVQNMGKTSRRLVASAGYVKRRGMPDTPAALREHDCLPHSTALGDRWSFSRDGRTQRVRVRGPVVANNSEATLALVRGGMGIGLLATWLVDADIRSGRLVTLLDDYETPSAKINALMPPGRYTPPRVGALVELLRDAWREL
ncbi:MAG: LysR family transcriptional regulator [Nannocystaceae bacterium]|nr:LysR family transcriptional regulator [bacterium]